MHIRFQLYQEKRFDVRVNLISYYTIKIIMGESMNFSYQSLLDRLWMVLKNGADPEIGKSHVGGQFVQKACGL